MQYGTRMLWNENSALMRVKLVYEYLYYVVRGILFKTCWYTAGYVIYVNNNEVLRYKLYFAKIILNPKNSSFSSSESITVSIFFRCVSFIRVCLDAVPQFHLYITTRGFPWISAVKNLIYENNKRS